MGAPPSRAGGAHSSFTDVSFQSTISGRPGAPGASKGSLARTARSVSSGSDSPSSLTALTRNWYFLPGSSPFTSCSVFSGSQKPAGVHLPVVTSIFSSVYPVSGRPPRSLGFSHLSLQPSLCTSSTSSGPSGLPGLSRISTSTVASSKPLAFSARSVLGHDGLRGLAGLARTGLVHGTDTELRERPVKGQTEAPAWRLLTEGVLGGGRLVRLQGLGLALLVDGLDPELVVVALLEALDLKLGLVCATHRHPAARGHVQLLHRVAGDGLATIVLRLVPLELGRVLGDVRHLERTLWSGRRGWGDQGRCISIMEMHTGVLTDGILDVELGVVVDIDDLDVVLRLDQLVALVPGDGWWRLASHVHVVVDGLARAHHDRLQVGPVDPRLEGAVLDGVHLGGVRRR
ncbi:hypothetical protein FOCC_FOCC013173 [Frankliniella occidentalis]|nr:hypothetical protein FOCC_FOCC013173 [Frankliniella occidentalis]